MSCCVLSIASFSLLSIASFDLSIMYLKMPFLLSDYSNLSKKQFMGKCGREEANLSIVRFSFFCSIHFNLGHLKVIKKLE